jgi:hypothetical protein
MTMGFRLAYASDLTRKGDLAYTISGFHLRHLYDINEEHTIAFRSNSREMKPEKKIESMRVATKLDDAFKRLLELYITRTEADGNKIIQVSRPCSPESFKASGPINS